MLFFGVHERFYFLLLHYVHHNNSDCTKIYKYKHYFDSTEINFINIQYYNNDLQKIEELICSEA